MKLLSKFQLVWFVAAALFTNSVVLRTLNLAHTGYWADEMSSIYFASQDTWRALFWDNSPPLYHLLLKIWMFFFGESEVATRSLSALFALSTTALWMRFGFRRYGYFGVVVFGLLHSYYSFSVAHGREARMYSLFEFACTVLLFQFVDVYEGRRVSGLRALAATAFALLTHVLAFIPVVSGFTFLCLTKKIPLRGRRLLLTFGALVVTGVLIALYVRWDNLGWQQLKFKIEENSRWPWLVLFQILESWPGVAAMVAAAIVATWAVVIKKKLSLVHYFLIYIVITFAAATAVGFLADRSLFLTRYYTFLTPLIIYIIGVTLLENVDLNKLPARTDLKSWGRMVATLALSISFLVGEIVATQTQLQTLNADWRGAAEVVGASARPVIYTSMPLSIQAPYFTSKNIDFKKIELYTPTIFEPLKNGFKNHRSVWVMGSYWHAVMFSQQLHEFVTKNNCSVGDHTIKIANAEPVILLQIICSDLR